MKICVVLSESKVISIEPDELCTVEDLKVLIESESGIPMSAQQLSFQGKVLIDTANILDIGLSEGDMLHLQSQNNPLRQQALELLQQAYSQPSFLNYLETQNPGLAQVLRTGNLDQVELKLREVAMQNQRFKLEKLQEETALEDDPLNPSAQLEIENRIQKKNIDDNLKYAVEFTPEVFASVEMLYIDCKVNKIPVQAFVDSGAQNTIISKACAERLEIMRFVDVSFRGEARGVGVGIIIGRIHSVNLEIGGKFFNCAFHVLETSSINMLFGLDMLKRHQCCIDLHKNVLTLNAGEISIPFIHESQIQKELEDYVESEAKELKIEKKQEEVKKTEEKKIEEKKIEEKIVDLPGAVKNEVKIQADTSKVSKLTRHGFSVTDAEEALRLFKGDEERAAAYLFEKHNIFDF